MTLKRRSFLRTTPLTALAGAVGAGAGHTRMNIGTSRRTLELALTNMASALEKV